MSPIILNSGIEFILLMQGFSTRLVDMMKLFSFMGTSDFYFLIFPALYWCVDSRLGLRLAAYLAASAGINSVFKIAFHSPRPYWYDIRVRLLGSPEFSFGLPSGHAQNAVVVWGLLAEALKKKWAWIFAGALAFLIGISRMYLGVHFPIDVYGGWAIGFILLFLLFRFEKPAVGWFRKLGQIQKICFVFLLSMVMIFSSVLTRNLSSGNFQIPEDWIVNASLMAPDEPIMPFSMENSIIAGATLFGFVAGIALFFEKGWLDSKGPLLKRVLRYVVGLIGVLIFWRGLGYVFSELAQVDSLFGYFLKYIHYSLVGIWISGLGPWVFITLRIGSREA